MPCFIPDITILALSTLFSIFSVRNMSSLMMTNSRSVKVRGLDSLTGLVQHTTLCFP
jgi:hypothetical protein